MDLDQPLSTRDPSSPGQDSHSSLPREQLPVQIQCYEYHKAIDTIDNSLGMFTKARHVWMKFTQIVDVCA